MFMRTDSPLTTCFHDTPNGNGRDGAREKEGNKSGMSGGGGGGSEASSAAPEPSPAPTAPQRRDYASMNAYQLRRAAAEAGMKGGARANRESALAYLNSLAG